MDRDQCCDQLILAVLDQTLRSAINNNTVVSDFTADVFTAVENASDTIRDTTDGMKLLLEYIYFKY